MKRLLALIVPLALAACSGGGTSLLGGGAPKPTAADLVSAPVNDPKTRAVQVAWNVSRAAKCGFNLDSAQLKQKYLAYESGNGLTPDALPALEKAYEFSRIETADRIAKAEGNYCTEIRVAETRKDLGRYLAGDFAARAIKAKKEVPSSSFLDAFSVDEVSQVTTEDALKPKE